MMLTVPLDERALEGSTMSDDPKPPDDIRKPVAVNGPFGVPFSSIRLGIAGESVLAHCHHGATSIGSLS